ncbi:MAG: hypothetical protein JSV99_06650 [Planctomycetota bacterium]|nr:MAG: hypothetical protein JSV99_06650 [Planctomycetota bacterium]
MNKRNTIAGISCPAVWITLLVTLVSSTALGQYEVSWHTIDAGGGVSSGGQYIVTGTIGQAEGGRSAGGGYEVLGGFWPGGPLCTVEFHHYARFAEYWLSSGCDAGNDWCGGADLDQLGDVGGVDLGLFVEEWLYWCPYDWPLK